MKVKVCGMTTLEQLQALPGVGAEYAGLIFTPASSRYAGKKFYPFRKQVREMPVQKVGVFVNSSEDEILSAVEDFGLSLVQLHGDEDADLVNRINRQVPVIKVIRLPLIASVQEQLRAYSPVCSYFLFDTRGEKQGGNGEKFDWSLLHEVAMDKPFFLSGGIGPSDAKAVQDFNNHKPLFGVDINSRFETLPGIKDLDNVARFIRQVKGPRIFKTT